MLTASCFVCLGLPLSVYLAAVFTNLACAQETSCQNASLIRIAFNESDEDPNSNDPQFLKTIMISRPINIIGNNTNPFRFKDKFSFEYSTALQGHYLRMTGSIDRDGTNATAADDITILEYNIECIPSPNSEIVYGILRIIILDVNDNPPVFNQSSYFVVVREDFGLHGVVYQGISTTDLDEGANKTVRFSLVSRQWATFDGTGVFGVDEFTGVIYLEQELDFDNMHQAVGGNTSLVRYDYHVIARDQGNPVMSSTTAVTILITDADDLGPTFYYQSCIFTGDGACFRPKYDSYVFSNDSSGSRLTTVPVSRGTNDEEGDILVYDRDTLKSSINCSIYDVTPENYFSGGYFQVRTNHTDITGQYECIVYHVADKPISRARNSSIELILRAQEETKNGRSAYATVNITVREKDWASSSTTPDPNAGRVEISPTFAVGYINENSVPGSFVSSDTDLVFDLLFSIMHTVQNPNASHTDLLISQDPPSPFTVTQNGLVAVSQASLDFESRQMYEFTVYISEQSQSWATASADVTIIVLDLNDHSPVFVSGTGLEVDVEEGDYSLSEESIFTLTVTDGDGTTENSEVTLDLVSVYPTDGIGKFRLDASGALFVIGDVSADNFYQVQVTAMDNGIPQLTSSVIVVVDIIEAEPTETDDGLATGALVGIAVGATLIVVLAIILIACLAYRRRRDKGNGGGYVNRGLERNHEPKNTTVINRTYTEKDQPYVYADGFIHKNSSNQTSDTSAYNTLGPEQDDEEVYSFINESAVVEDNNNSAPQPSDAPENSYSQPMELFPPSDDMGYLTPSLPKRNRPKLGDGNSSSQQPTTAAVMDGRKDSMPYYSQPTESGVSFAQNATDNQYLGRTATGPYTQCETPSEAKYLEIIEAEKGDNEHTDNGNQNRNGNETSKNEKAASDKSDVNTYYDALVPDDPNYSNLDRDPREYFRVNMTDQVSSL